MCLCFCLVSFYLIPSTNYIEQITTWYRKNASSLSKLRGVLRLTFIVLTSRPVNNFKMVENRFKILSNIYGGRIVKMEVDYTGTCDEKIPLYKEMAKDSRKFLQSIDILLKLEKQTRMVGCLVAICSALSII